ncbi:MAG: excinuclease ABC subunit UvrC [Proteobacteria bacterium]|nr:excinuclease ABC subunit UvrC [Pseudomonadota bacterium]
MPPVTPPADAAPAADVPAAPLAIAEPGVDPARPFDPKAFVGSLPARPGVYRMLDAAGQILYVGKAANLRARVASYFRADLVQPKVVAMVQQIAAIEVTVTSSETEALLLEFNLIKKHRPHYNILLKDDKSFPYLYLSTDQAFPRLSFYRGPRKGRGRYFGPYPSTTAVRETLLQLQKLFRLRQCEDSYFENRTRPCLQYQIARCTAPCVGLVSREDYAADVAAAARVLEGRNDEVAAELARRMEEEAGALRFERAAALRDQLAALKSVQAHQIVSASADVDCDVVAAATGPGLCAIGLLFIRAGRNLGTTTYFARAPLAEREEVESAFLAQHYLAHEAPVELVVGTEIAEREALAEALAGRAGHRVEIHRAERGLKARWVEMALDNAVQALRMRLLTEAGVEEQLAALGQALGLPAPPSRLECFDISHTRGEATVASCVVFGREGPLKADYRRFNLEGLTPGDDYGAMRQALTRRYRRLKSGEGKLPDVLFIDGGPGQLAEAQRVLAELEVTLPAVVGVAKGADRRVGQERLFLLGSEVPLILPPDSRALHLVQRIRDEAHRFAITGHRARRGKARQASVLEEVPGLGPARRRELLKRFGGLQGVLGAGIEDLAQVRGIGRHLAEAIYERLHPDG